MLSEMNMMKNIGKHKNIVNLIGCCTQNGKTTFSYCNFSAQKNIAIFSHYNFSAQNNIVIFSFSGLCNHVAGALLMVLYTYFFYF